MQSLERVTRFVDKGLSLPRNGLSHMKLNPPAKGLIPVLLIAVAVLSLANSWVGWEREPTYDAEFYLSFAENLANGNGYINSNSFWPQSPTMDRPPGWPILQSFGLRLLPNVSPPIVMRILSLVCSLVVVLFVFLITLDLSGRSSVAFLASMLYLFNPLPLFLEVNGLSEIPFLALWLVGVRFFLRNPFCTLSGLVFGCAMLVRPSFLFFGVFLFCFWFLKKRDFQRSHLSRVAIFFTLFFLPIFAWTLRNFNVSGHFPVLSTLSGETLFGGNNVRTATEFQNLGAWIFPNEIEGTISKKELALRGTEIQMNKYYTEKAVEFLTSHPLWIPHLVLAKLAKGFGSFPFDGRLSDVIVALLKLVIYSAAIMALRSGSWPLNLLVQIKSMALACFVVVVVYWGSTRFVLPLDVLLLPLAAPKLMTLMESLKRRFCLRSSLS
ncbi:MAG: hypothetical protein R3B54_05355 [Bdellovibrionota bacterium]